MITYITKRNYLQPGDLVKYSGHLILCDGNMVFDELGIVIKIADAWIIDYGCLCHIKWVKTGKVTKCYERAVKKV